MHPSASGSAIAQHVSSFGFPDIPLTPRTGSFFHVLLLMLLLLFFIIICFSQLFLYLFDTAPSSTAPFCWRPKNTGEQKYRTTTLVCLFPPCLSFSPAPVELLRAKFVDSLQVWTQNAPRKVQAYACHHRLNAFTLLLGRVYGIFPLSQHIYTGGRGSFFFFSFLLLRYPHILTDNAMTSPRVSPMRRRGDSRVQRGDAAIDAGVVMSRLELQLSRKEQDVSSLIERILKLESDGGRQVVAISEAESRESCHVRHIDTMTQTIARLKQRIATLESEQNKMTTKSDLPRQSLTFTQDMEAAQREYTLQIRRISHAVSLLESSVESNCVAISSPLEGWVWDDSTVSLTIGLLGGGAFTKGISRQMVVTARDTRGGPANLPESVGVKPLSGTERGEDFEPSDLLVVGYGGLAFTGVRRVSPHTWVMECAVDKTEGRGQDRVGVRMLTAGGALLASRTLPVGDGNIISSHAGSCDIHFAPDPVPPGGTVRAVVSLRDHEGALISTPDVSCSVVPLQGAVPGSVTQVARGNSCFVFSFVASHDWGVARVNVNVGLDNSVIEGCVAVRNVSASTGINEVPGRLRNVGASMASLLVSQSGEAEQEVGRLRQQVKELEETAKAQSSELDTARGEIAELRAALSSAQKLQEEYAVSCINLRTELSSTHHALQLAVTSPRSPEDAFFERTLVPNDVDVDVAAALRSASECCHLLARDTEGNTAIEAVVADVSRNITTSMTLLEATSPRSPPHLALQPAPLRAQLQSSQVRLQAAEMEVEDLRSQLAAGSSRFEEVRQMGAQLAEQICQEARDTTMLPKAQKLRDILGSTPMSAPPLHPSSTSLLVEHQTTDMRRWRESLLEASHARATDVLCVSECTARLSLVEHSASEHLSIINEARLSGSALCESLQTQNLVQSKTLLQLQSDATLHLKAVSNDANRLQQCIESEENTSRDDLMLRFEEVLRTEAVREELRGLQKVSSQRAIDLARNEEALRKSEAEVMSLNHLTDLLETENNMRTDRLVSSTEFTITDAAQRANRGWIEQFEAEMRTGLHLAYTWVGTAKEQVSLLQSLVVQSEANGEMQSRASRAKLKSIEATAATLREELATQCAAGLGDREGADRQVVAADENIEMFALVSQLHSTLLHTHLTRLGQAQQEADHAEASKTLLQDNLIHTHRALLIAEDAVQDELLTAEQYQRNALISEQTRIANDLALSTQNALSAQHSHHLATTDHLSNENRSRAYITERENSERFLLQALLESFLDRPNVSVESMAETERSGLEMDECCGRLELMRIFYDGCKIYSDNVMKGHGEQLGYLENAWMGRGERLEEAEQMVASLRAQLAASDEGRRRSVVAMSAFSEATAAAATGDCSEAPSALQHAEELIQILQSEHTSNIMPTLQTTDAEATQRGILQSEEFSARVLIQSALYSERVSIDSNTIAHLESQITTLTSALTANGGTERRKSIILLEEFSEAISSGEVGERRDALQAAKEVIAALQHERKEECDQMDRETQYLAEGETLRREVAELCESRARLTLHNTFTSASQTLQETTSLSAMTALQAELTTARNLLSSSDSNRDAMVADYEAHIAALQQEVSSLSPDSFDGMAALSQAEEVIASLQREAEAARTASALEQLCLEETLRRELAVLFESRSFAALLGLSRESTLAMVETHATVLHVLQTSLCDAESEEDMQRNHVHTSEQSAWEVLISQHIDAEHLKRDIAYQQSQLEQARHQLSVVQQEHEEHVRRHTIDVSEGRRKSTALMGVFSEAVETAQGTLSEEGSTALLRAEELIAVLRAEREAEELEAARLRMASLCERLAAEEALRREVLDISESRAALAIASACEHGVIALRSKATTPLYQEEVLCREVVAIAESREYLAAMSDHEAVVFRAREVEHMKRVRSRVGGEGVGVRKKSVVLEVELASACTTATPSLSEEGRHALDKAQELIALLQDENTTARAVLQETEAVRLEGERRLRREIIELCEARAWEVMMAALASKGAALQKERYRRKSVSFQEQLETAEAQITQHEEALITTEGLVSELNRQLSERASDRVVVATTARRQSAVLEVELASACTTATPSLSEEGRHALDKAQELIALLQDENTTARAVLQETEAVRLEGERRLRREIIELCEARAWEVMMAALASKGAALQKERYRRKSVSFQEQLETAEAQITQHEEALVTTEGLVSELNRQLSERASDRADPRELCSTRRQSLAAETDFVAARASTESSLGEEGRSAMDKAAVLITLLKKENLASRAVLEEAEAVWLYKEENMNRIIIAMGEAHDCHVLRAAKPVQNATGSREPEQMSGMLEGSGVFTHMRSVPTVLHGAESSLSSRKEAPILEGSGSFTQMPLGTAVQLEGSGVFTQRRSIVEVANAVSLEGSGVFTQKHVTHSDVARTTTTLEGSGTFMQTALQKQPDIVLEGSGVFTQRHSIVDVSHTVQAARATAALEGSGSTPTVLEASGVFTQRHATMDASHTVTLEGSGVFTQNHASHSDAARTTTLEGSGTFAQIALQQQDTALEGSGVFTHMRSAPIVLHAAEASLSSSRNDAYVATQQMLEESGSFTQMPAATSPVAAVQLEGSGVFTQTHISHPDVSRTPVALEGSDTFMQTAVQQEEGTPTVLEASGVFTQRQSIVDASRPVPLEGSGVFTQNHASHSDAARTTTALEGSGTFMQAAAQKQEGTPPVLEGSGVFTQRHSIVDATHAPLEGSGVFTHMRSVPTVLHGAESSLSSRKEAPILEGSGSFTQMPLGTAVQLEGSGVFTQRRSIVEVANAVSLEGSGVFTQKHVTHSDVARTTTTLEGSGTFMQTALQEQPDIVLEGSGVFTQRHSIVDVSHTVQAARATTALEGSGTFMQTAVQKEEGTPTVLEGSGVFTQRHSIVDASRPVPLEGSGVFTQNHASHSDAARTTTLEGSGTFMQAAAQKQEGAPDVSRTPVALEGSGTFMQTAVQQEEGTPTVLEGSGVFTQRHSIVDASRPVPLEGSGVFTQNHASHSDAARTTTLEGSGTFMQAAAQKQEGTQPVLEGSGVFTQRHSIVDATHAPLEGSGVFTHMRSVPTVLHGAESSLSSRNDRSVLQILEGSGSFMQMSASSVKLEGSATTETHPVDTSDRAALQALEEQNRALEEELSLSMSRGAVYGQEMHDRITDLVAKNEELIRDGCAVRCALAEQEKAAARSKTALDIASRTIDTLHGERANLVAELTPLRAGYSTLHSENSLLRSTLPEDRLRELDDARTQPCDAPPEHAANAILELQAENDALRAELSQIGSENAHSPEAQSEALKKMQAALQRAAEGTAGTVLCELPAAQNTEDVQSLRALVSESSQAVEGYEVEKQTLLAALSETSKARHEAEAEVLGWQAQHQMLKDKLDRIEHRGKQMQQAFHTAETQHAEEMEASRTSVRTLREENARLQRTLMDNAAKQGVSELADLRRAVSEASRDRDASAAEVSQLRQRLFTISQSPELLCKSNPTSEERLRASPKALDPDAFTPRANAIEEATVAMLRTQNDELHKSREEFEELLGWSGNALRDARTQAQHAAVPPPNTAPPQLDERNAMLEAIHTLEASHHELSERLQHATQRCNTAEHAQRHTQRSLENTSAEVTTLRAENEALRKSEHGDDDVLQRCQEALHSAGADIRSLRMQVDELRAELLHEREKTQRNALLQGRSPELRVETAPQVTAELEEALQLLQDATQDAHRSPTASEDLHSVLRDVTAERDVLKAENEALRNTASGEAPDDSLLLRSQQALTQAVKDMESMRSDRADLKASLDKACDTAYAELTACRKENVQLKTQLSHRRRSLVDSNEDAGIDGALQQLGELKAVREAEQAVQAEVGVLRASLQRAEAEIEILKAETDVLRSLSDDNTGGEHDAIFKRAQNALQQAVLDMEAMREACDTAQADLLTVQETSSAKLRDAKIECVRLRTQLEQMQRKKSLPSPSGLLEALDQLEANSPRKENNASLRETHTLREALREARTDNDVLCAENEALRASMAEMPVEDNPLLIQSQEAVQRAAEDIILMKKEADAVQAERSYENTAAESRLREMKLQNVHLKAQLDGLLGKTPSVHDTGRLREALRTTENQYTELVRDLTAYASGVEGEGGDALMRILEGSEGVFELFSLSHARVGEVEVHKADVVADEESNCAVNTAATAALGAEALRAVEVEEEAGRGAISILQQHSYLDVVTAAGDSVLAVRRGYADAQLALHSFTFGASETSRRRSTVVGGTLTSMTQRLAQDPSSSDEVKMLLSTTQEYVDALREEHGAEMRDFATTELSRFGEGEHMRRESEEITEASEWQMLLQLHGGGARLAQQLGQERVADATLRLERAAESIQDMHQSNWVRERDDACLLRLHRCSEDEQTQRDFIDLRESNARLLLSREDTEGQRHLTRELEVARELELLSAAIGDTSSLAKSEELLDVVKKQHASELTQQERREYSYIDSLEGQQRMSLETAEEAAHQGLLREESMQKLLAALPREQKSLAWETAFGLLHASATLLHTSVASEEEATRRHILTECSFDLSVLQISESYRTTTTLRDEERLRMVTSNEELATRLDLGHMMHLAVAETLSREGVVEEADIARSDLLHEQRSMLCDISYTTSIEQLSAASHEAFLHRDEERQRLGISSEELATRLDLVYMMHLALAETLSREGVVEEADIARSDLANRHRTALQEMKYTTSIEQLSDASHEAFILRDEASARSVLQLDQTTAFIELTCTARHRERVFAFEAEISANANAASLEAQLAQQEAATAQAEMEAAFTNNSLLALQEDSLRHNEEHSAQQQTSHLSSLQTAETTETAERTQIYSSFLAEGGYLQRTAEYVGEALARYETSLGELSREETPLRAGIVKEAAEERGVLAAWHETVVDTFVSDVERLLDEERRYRHQIGETEGAVRWMAHSFAEEAEDSLETQLHEHVDSVRTEERADRRNIVERRLSQLDHLQEIMQIDASTVEIFIKTVSALNTEENGGRSILQTLQNTERTNMLEQCTLKANLLLVCEESDRTKDTLNEVIVTSFDSLQTAEHHSRIIIEDIWWQSSEEIETQWTAMIATMQANIDSFIASENHHRQNLMQSAEDDLKTMLSTSTMHNILSLTNTERSEHHCRTLLYNTEEEEAQWLDGAALQLNAEWKRFGIAVETLCNDETTQRKVMHHESHEFCMVIENFAKSVANEKQIRIQEVTVLCAVGMAQAMEEEVHLRASYETIHSDGLCTLRSLHCCLIEEEEERYQLLDSAFTELFLIEELLINGVHHTTTHEQYKATTLLSAERSAREAIIQAEEDWCNVHSQCVSYSADLAVKLIGCGLTTEEMSERNVRSGLLEAEGEARELMHIAFDAERSLIVDAEAKIEQSELNVAAICQEHEYVFIGLTDILVGDEEAFRAEVHASMQGEREHLMDAHFDQLRSALMQEEGGGRASILHDSLLSLCGSGRVEAMFISMFGNSTPAELLQKAEELYNLEQSAQRDILFSMETAARAILESHSECDFIEELDTAFEAAIRSALPANTSYTPPKRLSILPHIQTALQIESHCVRQEIRHLADLEEAMRGNIISNEIAARCAVLSLESREGWEGAGRDVVALEETVARMGLLAMHEAVTSVSGVAEARVAARLCDVEVDGRRAVEHEERASKRAIEDLRRGVLEVSRAQGATRVVIEAAAARDMEIFALRFDFDLYRRSCIESIVAVEDRERELMEVEEEAKRRGVQLQFRVCHFFLQKILGGKQFASP